MGRDSTYRYLAYGLLVESEFRLTTIGEAALYDRPPIELSFELSGTLRRRVGAFPADPDDWVQHAVLADGSVYMKVDGVFEALVSADGRSVRCAPPGDIDRRSFEANLLNFAFSAALTLQGEEPLHATVLDLDGRAFALLGPSGTGKSTLAAFLVAQGATLVTDDMLRLTFAHDKALAHHGPHRLKLFEEPARRLLPDAVSDGYFNVLSEKFMIEPAGARHARRDPRPLAALFWLGEPPAQPESDDISATRLSGVELMRVLTASAMDIRNHTPDRLARQLNFVEHIGRTLPVYALQYPRRYELLDEVAGEIRRVVGP